MLKLNLINLENMIQYVSKRERKMVLNLFKDCKPDSYVPSIYDIRYPKLSQNGIKYAIFDVDCTILPFDDINVTEENEVLFRYINNLGIQSALCSSAFDSRVRPVAEALNINYMSSAPKPFVKFSSIAQLFDGECSPDEVVYIGDSLYLDMYLAAKINVHKILVDMIQGDFNVKYYTNEVMQNAMFMNMKQYGLVKKKYYRGFIER